MNAKASTLLPEAIPNVLGASNSPQCLSLLASRVSCLPRTPFAYTCWLQRRMVQVSGLHTGHCSHALSFRSSVANVAAFRLQNSSAAAQRGLRQLKV